MGTASIRLRFLTLVTVLVLALVGVVVYTNISAKRTIEHVNLVTSQEQDLGESLSRVADLLHNLGFQVYQTSFVFDQFPSQKIIDQVNALQAEIDRQSAKIENYEDSPYADSIEQLNVTLTSLFAQVSTLIDVQKNVETLYPAMPIMVDKLQPINSEFMATVVVAIDEAYADMDKPDQARIYDQLRDIRYLWAQLISSVRVFVANRLGAFGPSRSSMEATDSDRKLYVDAIYEILRNLEKLDKKNRLGFVQSNAVKSMRSLLETYEREFKRVADIYYSDKWRADHVLIREGLNPLMEKAWQQIGELKQELNTASQTGFDQYERTTDVLSRFIWMVVGVVITLLVAAYIAFELFIRRPVLQVATALEAEGAGQTYEPKTNHQALEIKKLLNAFSHMRTQVRSRQLRLQAILDNAGEGIITINRSGKVESMNKAAEILFGCEEKSSVGRSVANYFRRESFEDIAHFDIRQVVDKKDDDFPFEEEIVGVRFDGIVFPMSVRWGTVDFEGYRLFIALVSDISERRAMMDRLTDLAEKDALTGIYNRHYFVNEIERVVERSHRNDKENIALLYLDLDNFKYVNDTLGHLAGDKVLREVTDILQQRARGSDMLARLGGDEFAIILYDVDIVQATTAAEAYRRRLAEYVFHYDRHIVDVGCSIGVAMLSPTILKKEEFLARADLACHVAKREGRNRVHIYEMDDQKRAHGMTTAMGWARRIKKSIERDNFVVVSQPIVSVNGAAMKGNEILLRMRDDNDELIMPSGFFPAAERLGLSTDLDRWVLSHSLRLLSEQNAANSESYSINISAKSIGDGALLKLIQHQLERYRFDPTKLVIEITETAAIGNVGQAVKFLQQLKLMGVKTALDDFGVGYSSFSYLRDLPVDYVKFDGSFVQNVASDPVKQAIVSSMNDVAHALGKKTIAEFVENRATFDFMSHIGVDFAQGYYIGMPTPLTTRSGSSNVRYLSDFVTPA